MMNIKKRRRIIALSKFYHPEEMEGITSYAREAGWALRFVISSREEIPQNWPYDGVIIIHGYSDKAMLRFVEANTAPIIFLGRTPISSIKAPQVWYDLNKSVVIARDYFIARDYRNLALIHNPLYDNAISQTKEALAKIGGHLLTIRLDRIEESILKAPKPLGIITWDDEWAREVYQICEENNIQVPEEVAILGASSTRHVCEFNIVPLSGVDTRIVECGFLAAQKLESVMQGQVVQSEFIPPQEIIVRESTSIPAIADKRVAKALKIIRRDYQQAIDLADIASECGLNRWSLDLLFKKEMQSTMSAYLMQIRLKEAERLLLETDKAINEISSAISYDNHVSFLRAFRRKNLCSPSEFRKKNKELY